MSLQTLSYTLPHVTSFLNPSEVERLGRVSKGLKKQLDIPLQDQYVKIFGQLRNPERFNVSDRPVIETLLSYVQKQPLVFTRDLPSDFKGDRENLGFFFDSNGYRPGVRYWSWIGNNFTSPKSFLDRWRWLTGVDNNLDREVQEKYTNSMNLLKKSQPSSIAQLQNQEKCFFYLNAQLHLYERFRSKEIRKAELDVIKSIFFPCFQFLMRFFFKLSSPIDTFRVSSKKEDSYAKIGEFNLDGKSYDILVFFHLPDALESDSLKTHIRIYEKGQPHDFLEKDPGFSLEIKRETREDKKGSEAYAWSESEFDGLSYQPTEVTHRQHIFVEYQSYYFSFDFNEKKKLLDQKLTQIMIEILMQNKKCSSLYLNALPPHLFANGFRFYDDVEMTAEFIKELQAFRLENDNEGFPSEGEWDPEPLKSTVSTFQSTDLNEKNVLRADGSFEAWVDLVKQNPLLKSTAANLPEYFLRKPRFKNE